MQMEEKGRKHTRPLKSEDEHNRRAALELAIRKKIELEKKALQIVERLMEEDVTEEFLLGCGRFITPAHYKDTVDERFIIKLCGYPLCQNKLEKVPKQKYKISTKTNKVYDITERKCFCSNFCYRASKYFEAQIPPSLLWMREEERPPDFKLLKPGQSGHSGEEIKLYEKPVMPSDIENPRMLTSHLKSSSSASESDNDSDSEQKFVSTMLTGKRSRALSLKKQPPKTGLPSEKSTSETKATDKGQKHIMLEITEELSKCRVDDKDKMNSTSVSFQTEELCAPGTDLTPSKLQVPEESGSQITSRGVSKRGAEHLRRMLSSSKQPLKSDDAVSVHSPIKENMLEALIKTFTEWKTDKTMEFLYGPQCTTIRASSSEKEELDADDLPLETLDIVRQKSHNSLNESLPFRQDGTADKPLPGFERLKEDTATLSLSVKEFYKGVYKDRDGKQDDPVLPLVDSSAQHQIRKRIVLDKLKKVLPSILVPLQITYNEVYTELNNLIKTFRLTNKNIYHKNPEWSLIAIVLLSILSPRISHDKDSQKNPLYTQFISTFLEELHFRNEDLETLINVFAGNSAVE
ncbi:putative RNA polymerase II subunit B1 CTD phosphatase RPAP2 [Microcaecilia unicolor]|uniref:RNA polymerase II subunit B1 CTD phosphatase RPAP2 homolog n=1 Tax=Microcaecilia unicolor TaxID=1415580 RepID=A0A6P7Y8B1_9AMPH|nr:putative RNA polymerase II subunit B1 CTD phosphatase RPAP2 [Microcaecilia unicolor]